MDLQDYLKSKHLEYINSIHEVINESDWVNDVLNQGLPRADRLSYPSVNHWMNGGRYPDATNIIKLIKIFGPGILPYVDIRFADMLNDVVIGWESLPEEVQIEIHDIVKRNNLELAPLQS